MGRPSHPALSQGCSPLGRASCFPFSMAFPNRVSPRVLWKAEGREPLRVEEDLLGLEQGRKGTESQRDAAGQAAAVGSKSFSLGWGIGEGSWPVKHSQMSHH